MVVYLLWHARDSDEDLDVKLLGVYSNEQNVESAKERAQSLPDFSDYSGQFHVDRYEVHKDHWAGGFIAR